VTYEVEQSAEVLNRVWSELRPFVLNRLDLLRKNLPMASRCPATGPLFRATIVRMEQWVVRADEHGPAFWGEFQQLHDEIHELWSWIFAGLPGADADKFGDLLGQAGFTYSQVRKLLENQPKKKGRPEGSLSRDLKNRPNESTEDNGRALYLTACGLKLSGWTVPRITNELCDCGRANHDLCEDRFKKGIARVKKLLEKYSGSTTPARR
jgi:hypothetical protein